MSNDDLVDSTVMALMRFRQGGFIRCLPMNLKNSGSLNNVEAGIIRGFSYGY